MRIEVKYSQLISCFWCGAPDPAPRCQTPSDSHWRRAWLSPECSLRGASNERICNWDNGIARWGWGPRVGRENWWANEPPGSRPVNGAPNARTEHRPPQVPKAIRST